MDPISLFLAGAAALFGVGAAAAAGKARSPSSYRSLLTWQDGWVATELLSSDLLGTAGASLGIPLLSARAAELESGMRRFVIVTKKGAPPSFAVLVVYDRLGRSVELAETWSIGMTRPQSPEQWQHVAELTAFLQRDVAATVVQMATQIADPQERYAFLKAVVRRAALAALVATDETFVAEVVHTTAEASPERLARVRKDPPPASIGIDLGISPLSAVPHDQPEKLLPGDSRAALRASMITGPTLSDYGALGDSPDDFRLPVSNPGEESVLGDEEDEGRFRMEGPSFIRIGA